MSILLFKKMDEQICENIKQKMQYKVMYLWLADGVNEIF